MSALLCGETWADADVGAEIVAVGVASLVAEFPHAPAAATAARTTTPVSTVLVLVTLDPFHRSLYFFSSLPNGSTGGLVVP